MLFAVLGSAVSMALGFAKNVWINPSIRVPTFVFMRSLSARGGYEPAPPYRRIQGGLDMLAKDA
jgi:hypothetical protein